MEQEPSDDQAVALLRRVRLNNSDLASILRLQTVWPDEAAALQRYCTDLVAGTAWGKEHVAWSSGSQPPERMPRPSGCTRRLRLKTGDLSDQRKSSFPIFDTIPAALQQVKAPSSLEFLGQEDSPTTSKLLRNICVSERTVYFFSDTGRGIPDRIDLGDHTGYLQVRSHRTCHEMAHEMSRQVMIFPTSRTQEPARIVPGRTILYAGCLLACLVGREKVLCPAGESCHLTHALEILASLPRDEGALAGSASYVIYNVDLYLQEGSTQSTKGFCKFVLDIFSLSFERLGFQLPSLHSLHAVTKPAEQLLCFEQLLITASSRVPSRTRRAEWSNATRDDAESDELRRLTYKYCGIRPRCEASGPEQRRTLLFFERCHNRLVKNAPQLCMQMRSSWETWLFEEPEDLNLCDQAEAIHWADVIVTHTGSQRDYAVLAACRGSVLILVHPYPEFALKLSTNWAFWHTGLHMLDYVETSPSPLNSSRMNWRKVPGLDRESDAPARENMLNLCAMADFPHMLMQVPAFGEALQGQSISFDHCPFILQEQDVEISTMEPYLLEASKLIGSVITKACYSSNVACEPPGFSPCRDNSACSG